MVRPVYVCSVYTILYFKQESCIEFEEEKVNDY